MSTPPDSRRALRVIWTRGKWCQELADLLSDLPAERAQGDPTEICITERADLLVSRRIRTGFDLVDSVSPVDVDADRIASVVAAVAGGPHSVLSAGIARRLGAALGVPASMVVAHPDGGKAQAREVAEEIVPKVPDLPYRTLQASGMSDLVDELPDNALLVFGAPGGSWFQRRLFGPGARLRSSAPAGSVVVQAAPRRVFQVMDEPVYVAPMLHAVDTLRIRPETTLAVAEEGRLVGLVRRERLASLEPDTPVGAAMEEPVSIGQVEPLTAAEPLRSLFGRDPIPVVDDDEHLVGGLNPPAA
jgi:hypothetical protein